jgi:DNA-binding GntR family transcriptional regulator
MLRLLLEGAAAHAAASTITPADVADLREVLERARSLVRLEDLPSERALSRELHSKIVAAAHNPLLHRMYLTVLNTFPDWLLYEHLYRQPELLEESMRNEFHEHSLIVEALAAHDPHLAVERSFEHVTNRGRELETYLGLSAESLKEREAQILPLFRASHPQEHQIQKELP